MLTLGIETSCDETAVAILEDAKKIRCNLVSSQTLIHQRYGGIVPELASRAHEHNLNFLLEEGLKEAKCRWEDISLVAVTNGPGLVGAIIVGVAAAKGISLSLSIPLIGVNHIHGHIYANWLSHEDVRLPSIALVVSGGHTALLLLKGHLEWELLGTTIDDACGEAFDKIGRLFGLSYPGGPAIDNVAENGDPGVFDFPRALLGEESLDFSFSGLKTSVARQFSRVSNGDLKEKLPDLAASFREAVLDVLIEKVKRAVKQTGISSLLLAGGVAANKKLREKLNLLKEDGILETLFIPPPELCTDNAAMIACAGYHEFKGGREDNLSLDVAPLWEILKRRSSYGRLSTRLA